jgi:glucose/mannose-6-phosphate isomerase
MYNKIKNFPKQISNTIDNTKLLSIGSDYDKVVIVGMGGSAIAGLIVKDLLPQVNIVVERNYIPNTAINQNTLVIVSSYSGKTEETLSYYHSAKELTNNIFGITSGGELLETLKNDNKDCYVLPEGYPPRSATGYSLTVLIKLLNSNLLNDLDIDLLQSYSDNYSSEGNEIHSLAKAIYSTMPIVVTEEDMTSIGFRLKSQFNENSKMLSYNITLPEMNHNEIVGWQSEQIDNSAFSLLWINIRHDKNIKRMTITNDILKDKLSFNNHIQVPSEIVSNHLASLLYLINYIDWLSYWCSTLRGVDIMNIDNIDTLKKSITVE